MNRLINEITVNCVISLVQVPELLGFNSSKVQGKQILGKCLDLETEFVSRNNTSIIGIVKMLMKNSMMVIVKITMMMIVMVMIMIKVMGVVRWC